MKGEGTEVAEAAMVVGDGGGGGEDGQAGEDEEWETMYSKEHAAVYYVNKLTRISSWKKE